MRKHFLSKLSGPNFEVTGALMVLRDLLTCVLYMHYNRTLNLVLFQTWPVVGSLIMVKFLLRYVVNLRLKICFIIYKK